MKVRWTHEAQKHLDGIYEYIARDSKEYARQTRSRLLKRSKQIMHFPYSGRMVPELNLPSVREVVEGPYRLVYTIREEIIFVIAVFHGATQPPWGK